MSELKTSGDPATWLLQTNASGVKWISTANGKLTIVSSISGLVRPSGVAGAGPEADANAAFILTACRMHAKLKAAAEFGLKQAEAWRYDISGGRTFKPGEVPDYDAACISVGIFREALGLPPEVCATPPDGEQEELEEVPAPAVEDPAQMQLGVLQT